MSYSDAVHLGAILSQESGLHNDIHHCVQDVIGDSMLGHNGLTQERSSIYIKGLTPSHNVDFFSSTKSILPSNHYFYLLHNRTNQQRLSIYKQLLQNVKSPLRYSSLVKC